MLYFKDAGDVLQSAVLTGWAMHVSILAEEDAVKGSATRAAMLKESIFYHVMTSVLASLPACERRRRCCSERSSIVGIKYKVICEPCT